MAMAPMGTASFGVGKVLSDTFQVFRIALVPLLLVMGGVTFVTSLITVAIGGGAALVGGGEMSDGAQAIFTIVTVALLVIAFGASVLIAFEAGHGRAVSIANCLTAASRQFIPMIVLGLVFYVVLVFLLMLVIVPGLWIMGVWAVTVPAIMIEGRGFGSLGRSADLTKGYRWPVIGTMILVQLIVGAVLFGTIGVVYAILGISFEDVLSGALAFMEAPGMSAIITVVVIQAVFNGLSYALFTALLVAIFMRLKDLKDGGGAGVAEVFN